MCFEFIFRFINEDLKLNICKLEFFLIHPIYLSGYVWWYTVLFFDNIKIPIKYACHDDAYINERKGI